MAGLLSVWGKGSGSEDLTLCENFPFARFTSRGVGKNVVELVEEVLHLAPALPLCHLVADAELWGTAVVTTALGQRSRMVCTLEARDAAVLHRVVVRCGYIWTKSIQCGKYEAGQHTVIEALLSRGEVGVGGEDAAVDRRCKAVLPRRNSGVFCTRRAAARRSPFVGINLSRESPGITLGRGSGHGVWHS